MKKEVLFSSQSDNWSTPNSYFNLVKLEFGEFDIDVAADEHNAKAKNYYTKEQDGLNQIWGGKVWCNPPYGRGIGKWVEKGSKSNALVVMLLPARTDTRWFHDYILGKAEIRFIKGRLKFGNSKNNAPFPSMLVIWRNNV